MANKYNFSMTITGIEATSNGVNAESISVSSDGEFGNELVSVFGQIFEGILTKIPTPTSTTTATPITTTTAADPEVRRVVEKVVPKKNKTFGELENERKYSERKTLEGLWGTMTNIPGERSLNIISGDNYKLVFNREFPEIDIHIKDESAFGIHLMIYAHNNSIDIHDLYSNIDTADKANVPAEVKDLMKNLFDIHKKNLGYDDVAEDFREVK